MPNGRDVRWVYYLQVAEEARKYKSAEEFVNKNLTYGRKYDILEKRSLTRYEQEQKIIPREIKRIIPESGKQYLATPRTRGRDFYTNLKKTNETHPYGQAVEVKEPQFYTDPKIKLFLSSDSSAGAAITPIGLPTKGLTYRESQSILVKTVM